MENNEIELFSDAGENPDIPVLDIDKPKFSSDEIEEKKRNYNNMDLISPDIGEAILGDTVKSLLIPTDLDIMYPNYVLDFREAKNLRQHQISALACILNEDGDTAIYVCLNNGMTKLGMGVGELLDDVLPIGIQSVFNGVCKLYKNVEKDKPLIEIKTKDINKMRLRL